MSKSDKPDKSSKREDSNLIIEYCEDIFAKLKEEKENRLVTKQPKHSYSRHTATVLQDGRVLLISSDGSEIFDPKGNAFYCPEPSKLKQEANLAVLLRDGRVLVVSSSRRPDAIQAELFDPVQETWEEIQAPKYNHAQGQLTLLANAQVLATGGAVSVGPPRYVDGHTHCEVWDPTTGEWTETEPLNNERYDHCAVALSDGSVVVIGGATKAIEQRRPDGSWHKVAELPYNLYEHQAVLLKEHILIIGGRTKRPSEAYAPVDTQKRTWLLQLADFKRIPAGDMIKERSSMVALLVQDDQVIVIGGSCESQSLKTTELWSLEKMKWSRGSNLGTVWSDHTASLLPDGRVFLLKNNSSDLVSPKPGLGCEKNCDPAYNQQVLHEGVEVEHGPWNIEHDDGTHEDGVFHYGKKEGQWNYWDFDEKAKVTHYANDLKEGLETLCWPGNRIQATQEFRGGAEHGVHREYDYTSQSDGKLQLELEAHYQNGELHGSYKKWSSGKLKLNAFYHEGELHGAYQAWRYGVLVKQGVYQHGKKHGEWMTMNNGKPKLAGNYINGLKDGEWIYSDIHDKDEHVGSKRQTAGKGVWKHGEPMEGFFFFEMQLNPGTKRCSGTFEAGQMHGLIQEWDYFGVHRETSYVHGVKEGLFTEYRDRDVKGEEGDYRNNQKDGHWIKWFSNGVISSDGSYVDGKKQGEWKTFNHHGELEKTEVFTNGELKGD